MGAAMKVLMAALQIPFKMPFSHASASRAASENVLVQILDNKNIYGFGECCPRPYVSGENISTVKEFIRSQEMADFWNMESWQDIAKFDEKKKYLIDKNAAAFCAAESALLDYLSRKRNMSVESFLTAENKKELFSKIVPPPNTTMVIGLSSQDIFNKKITKYLLMGFLHFKIKINADTDFLIKLHQHLSSPLANLVRKMGGSFRLDGNNCFNSANSALEETQRFQNLIVGLEEPLAKNKSSEKISLLKNSTIPLILDDSFVLLDDLKEALSISRNIIPNIRISKNGGLLRSLLIVRFCEQEKIPYILGSQVGETSLLTRLALCLVSLSPACRPLYFEGAFSQHLLSIDPMAPQLILGFGAKIKNISKVQNNAGLGMQLLAELKELNSIITFECVAEVQRGT